MFSEMTIFLFISSEKCKQHIMPQLLLSVEKETLLVIVGEKWEERVVLLQAVIKMIPPAFTCNFRVCSGVEV